MRYRKTFGEVTRRAQKIVRRRLKTMQRVSPRCTYCGKDLTGDVESFVLSTVDHKVPRAHGGFDRIDNLVPSCPTCNWLKNADEHRDGAITRRRIARQRFPYEFWLRMTLAQTRLALPAPDPSRLEEIAAA